MACGNMPPRRSRGAWPFLALALGLLRWQYDVNFCGVSSMSSMSSMSSLHGRSGKPARAWKGPPLRHLFQGKSEQPVPSRNISTMGTGDVSQWLTSLGLEEYGPNFKKAMIDGLMLANLTDEDLQEIGIDRGIDRKNILRHSHALIAQGWKKTTSSGSLWRPDTTDIVPDQEVKRFAPAVLRHMREEGLEIGLGERSLVTGLDNLLSDMQEQRDYLNIVEAANDMVWSHTARVRGGASEGAGVRDEIKEDQLQILYHANLLQRRIVAFSSAIEELAVVMVSQGQSMKEKMSDSERSVQKSELKEYLHTWKEKNSELAKGASVCPQALLDRVSARFWSQLPGGRAVQDNLDQLFELMQKKEEAANKCQRINSLADPDVKLALAARKNGLKGKIEQEEAHFQSLEKRRNELEEQRREYEKLKEKNQGLRSEQRNATKNIRDWHVKQFWRWAWKDEMEVYENQVKEDEEQRAADDQNLDVKLESVEKELATIEDEKVKVQEEIQNLKSKDSETFWKNTLEATGLLSAESEVNDTAQELDILRDQLLEAVKKTGVLNFRLAASLIAHHETTKTLLSEAVEKSEEAAVRMQQWVNQTERAITGSSYAMDVLPIAFLSLQQAHQEQLRSRKKSMAKQSALKRLLESGSGAVFLDPRDGNATLTA